MKYSTYQMDNFYQNLKCGFARTSSIMNYIQHLIIAGKCKKNMSVLEVCCGRGLMLPLLNRYSNEIDKYIGLDISFENLQEAQQMRKEVSHNNTIPFDISFIQGNVKDASKILSNELFDIVIYTSSIEHMDKKDGQLSLIEINKVLKKGGQLYISTPRTIKREPYKLQYKVHIYEWDYIELKEELIRSNFSIIEEIGLLQQDNTIIEKKGEEKFGKGFKEWYTDVKNKIPEQFLSTIISASFPESSKEILFCCTKN